MSRRANIKLRGILEGDGSQGCLGATRLGRCSESAVYPRRSSSKATDIDFVHAC